MSTVISGLASRDGRIWAWLFLAPNLIVFSVFAVIPVIGAFALSFFEWDLLKPPSFVGLDNYVALVSDQRALNSIRVTLVLVAGTGIPTVLLGFILANALHARLRGAAVLRTMYYFPIIISLVASAVLWRWIFDVNGAVNWLLSLVGVTGPRWLSDQAWAIVAVMIVLVWKGLPLAIILYIAALQNVSEELVDAAKVDGAGLFRRMRDVIWPSVRPATTLITVVTVIGLIFGSFDVIAVMTRGGPLRSTESLAALIYYVGFRDLQLGYASAVAVAAFLVIFVGTLLVTRGRR